MSLTVRNACSFVAQFTVFKGQLIAAHLPGIAPDAQLQIPLADTYEVVATTLLEGNTYTSAPMVLAAGTGFLAQVLQNIEQGSYEFNVQEIPSIAPNALTFQKTCLNPVYFTISKDGLYMQTVVVSDSFEMQTLELGDTYSAYAVVNGITTAMVSTTNPNAVITATQDNGNPDMPFFTLTVE